MAKFKKEWFVYFNSNMAELAEKLNAGSALSDEDKDNLKKAIESFKKTF